jgi:hypothetical protein
VRAIHYVLRLVHSGCHDQTLSAFLYCWVLELLGWLLQFLLINRHIWKRIPSMIKNLETLIMAFSFNLFWASECNWQWFASWVWLTDPHEQMLVGNDSPAQRSSSLLLAAACSLATLAILTCCQYWLIVHVCLPQNHTHYLPILDPVCPKLLRWCICGLIMSPSHSLTNIVTMKLPRQVKCGTCQHTFQNL